ncbi:hypothetical protein BC830DRAFT_518493 [Chytriomyces sp. MP71]|nr:hypothetical protein BC830DRAFT_518493 [Chytriomyces sp. MP71]
MGELAGIIERRFGTRSRSSKADWLNPIELLMGSCVSHLLSPSFFYPHISIRWWSEDFVFKLRQFKSQNKGIMQAGSISSLASRSQPIASTHMPRSHMHKATSDSIQPDPVPPPAKSKSLQSLTQILPRVSIPTMPISLNRTQSPLYTVKNPIKVSDVSRVLLEICESLARIGTKLKDNGKLNKNMSEIYENFASRKEDIKIYTKTSPASVSSSLQTLTESSAAFVNPDPRLSSIQCSLHNLYMAAFTLSQLLSPISPSSLKVENKYSWITMGFKRVRLFEVYADVERAWHTLRGSLQGQLKA